MDPKYTAETLKHLEKESELLSNAHKTMSDELHRLQVEEEMLMRKFHELMSAHGLAKKKGFNDNAEERQNGREGALVNMTNGADERENGWEAALVDMTDGADERQNDLEGAVS
ncbi:putative protein isoform X1 [Capsicum chacoense]|uniref:uncharacterized protein LOC107841754 isoform X1 n=1 Tax=Capsicum annuum TaxID=4072 RepID=UPI0007BEBF0B|nr:uncharacterized protein LOC107841754 isoform X1 [Capsicum annuum]